MIPLLFSVCCELGKTPIKLERDSPHYELSKLLMWEPGASEITTLTLSDLSSCWQYLTDSPPRPYFLYH